MFGSVERAQDASNALLWTTEWALIASVAATPSGTTPGGWAVNKAKGAAVDYLAVELGDRGTDALKDATGRTRPDGSDDRSMPSGHAMGAALRATLASRNIRHVLEGPKRDVADAACASLVLLCAWSRLEARRHFPSDVLVGMALGHFVGVVADQAFLHASETDHTRVALVPWRGGLALRVEWGP